MQKEMGLSEPLMWTTKRYRWPNGVWGSARRQKPFFSHHDVNCVIYTVEVGSSSSSRTFLPCSSLITSSRDDAVLLRGLNTGMGAPGGHR